MHIAFAIFGMAVMLGLDTLVSQAYGARDIRECHRWFFDGLMLAAPDDGADHGAARAGVVRDPVARLSQAVRPLLESYFGVLMLSTPFLLAYAVCRRYLQGMHAATPIMFALVTANVINAAGNWVLIYGHFGFPALGVAGSAWATVISRAYMLGVAAVRGVVDRSRRTAELLARPALAGALARRACGTSIARSIAARLRRLLALGLPAASQVGAEVGVFALATALSGTLDPISSASHQIALNMAGVAFMIPLGLGSAGAVRVGHAVGAGDRAARGGGGMDGDPARARSS